MADDLFSAAGEAPSGSASGPLAARMRPTRLEEVVGQEQLLEPGSVLRSAIEQGRPFSMLLHGPPGSGKTTIARLVAGYAEAAFEELSAVQAGKAEVTKVIERARERKRMNRDTILFLDEIHRFNKAQQDALLPAVEDGTLTLIGATTENPYFEVNSALISRMRVVELNALTDEDVTALLKRAIAQEQCPPVSDEVLEFIAGRADGDARTALTALEIACAAGEEVTMEVAEGALQKRAVHYDKGGDQHYDLISAWIKATRGSDPDASLYYLAVMLEGGEDARFIARRMVILASEDVGNADPQALVIATSTAAAVEHAGLPECTYALAQCAIYLSLAPKSNSAGSALAKAREHVKEHGAQSPPVWLRPGMRGEGYEYPHSLPAKVSPQDLLPPSVEGTRFYEPAETERDLAERLERIRKARGR
ncbi:MAG TPA: replication-associated recombination protein A [Baekduia sp.]|nr:replication-associated recombination protein A [Baekduia sp.]